MWLRRLGTLLMDCQTPQPADAALVLAGDGYGVRIIAGADLARRGMVPKVLVSGPPGMYGFNEDELAIRYAVTHGYPEQMFVGVPMDAHSTTEEAMKWVPVFRRMGIRNLDLVTSDYHTGRAGRTFRKAAPDIRITTVCTGNALFDTQQWWKTREGRKAIFLELTKTVTDWFGL